jgi:hypothetical protein
MSIHRNPHIHLFIHRENQRILWDIIHQSPLWEPFSRVVVSSSTTPEKWFQQMIEKEYNSLLQARNEDMTEDSFVWLSSTNKSFIQRMIRNISSRVYATTPKTAPTIDSVSGMPVSFGYDNSPFANSYTNMSLSSSLSPSSSSLSSPSQGINDSPTLVYSAPRNYDTPHISAFDVERERKEKQDKAKREFEAYQNQYNSLLVTNVPTAPVFNETLQMEKITNMDELLKQQQEMRERDSRIVSSAPLPATQTVGMSVSRSGFVDRDNIKQEVMNVFLQQNHREKPPIDTSKKTVSWEI